MTIEVEVEAGWTEAVPDAEQVTTRAVEAALAEAEAEDAGSIAVRLTDDVTVRALNARFRGQDKATNVLSFPAPPTPDRHLGDIALALETCAREAAEQGKALSAHLAHLATHGTLHLLGHDHEADADAEAMEALERRALARLNLPDPYAIA